MQILLVEDSATLRHSMSSHIRAAGHQALIVGNGVEALQLIEHQPVDMVIMDVDMPGLDGYETTRILREWLGKHWIPIIFITGEADDSSVEAGIEAGGDDYLIKPVSAVMLKSKIRAMERIVDMRNQLQRLNLQLERASRTDGLTQLLNRRSFNEVAEQQWALARRNGHALALIMIDIDHFKDYNDHYGHPEGDSCLLLVATALQHHLPRATDIIARYGGEEFIALLPETSPAGARQVAENLRAAIARLRIPHARSSAADTVTISVGLACCDNPASRSLTDLLRQADAMLYRAKAAGRNQVMTDGEGATKTLLTINSDRHALNLLHQQLGSTCTIVTAENCFEFLDLAYHIQPDLLLLEADNPALDAERLCRALRQAPQTVDIPILLLADHSREPADLQQLGVDACLLNPLDDVQIETRIRNYLR